LEIGIQIKQRRTAAGLSQEELAQAIFVTRQTLSNWETGKTYPDINSLLRLSAVFRISLDELVKGDIETMKEEIKKEDIEKLRRGNRNLWILLGATGVGAVLVAMRQNALTIGITFALAAAAAFYSIWLERLQRSHSIHTYRELQAFLAGKRLDELEAAVEQGRMESQRTILLLLIVVIALLGVLSAFVTPMLLQRMGL